MQENKNILTAFLFVIALGAVTSAGVSQAWAQKEQSKACPEGFELNRGVCQAEPTITPGECPDSLGNVDVIVEENGRCETANTLPPATFITACEEANGVIILEPGEHGLIRCNFPAPPGESRCDIGTLNEDSGLCEVKPGRK